MTHKDSQGVVLEVGQKVAYNRSGEVVPGTITKLGEQIHIAYEGNTPIYDPDFNSYRPGVGYAKMLRKNPVSRVRNGSSVLVLP